MCTPTNNYHQGWETPPQKNSGCCIEFFEYKKTQLKPNFVWPQNNWIFKKKEKNPKTPQKNPTCK